MTRFARFPRLAPFALLALLFTGCGPSGPLNVATLQLGRSLNSDDSVGSIASRFKPDDTVYIAVITDGAGKGTVRAKWSYRGQTVNDESKDVSQRDGGATEFHIHYAGGAPLGDYRVEIEVDGKPVGSRDFAFER